MTRGLRFLLYSHDTVGLGNLRRTLLICEILSAAHPEASTLIVTGSPMAHGFSLPPRTDYVKLPSLDRERADVYRARSLVSSTGEVKRARSDLLVATLRGFDPDLVVVDKRPTGVGGELLPALEALRARGRARLVLGVRDVLDDRWTTRRSLARTRSFETIDRYYDEIWIYGNASVFDATKEYAFPDSAVRKTRFCGYLRYPTGTPSRRIGRPGVLVTVGGGQDGSALIQTYLEGLSQKRVPASLRTRVLLGPQMPEPLRAFLRTRYEGLPGLRLEEFTPQIGRLYAAADIAVAMAGYNTVCELLSNGCPAVLVPRAEPVREQLIRARRLAELGLFRVIEPDQLEPELLMDELFAALARPRPRPDSIDLNGIPRILERVRVLLEGGGAA